MKILSIVIKELKHNFRDKRLIVIMILFPLVLMVILGVAFSGSFDENRLDFSNTKVIYHFDKEEEFSKQFIKFIKNFDDIGMTFKNIDKKENAVKLIKNNYYACYIEINEDNKEIKLYKNSRYNFEAGFVEIVLQTFVQRYNMILEVSKVNPSSLKEIVSNKNNSFVKIESINKKKTPRSIDYYGITMLTLIIMYSMMTGESSIRNEGIIGTESRMQVAPIKKYEIFIGKVLGAFFVTIFQMLIVIIFSINVLGVNFGKDIGTVLLLIGSQIIMNIFVGVGIGIIIKKEEIADGLMHIIIPIMIFLGGGYIPIEQFNIKTLNLISNISPVKWTNKAIFNIIYINDYKYVKNVLTINMIIALIFFMISFIKFIKKEVV